MKNVLLLFFLSLFFVNVTEAQETPTLQINAETIIKDTAGTRISLNRFISLMESDQWTFDPKTDANGVMYIQMLPLSENQQNVQVAMEEMESEFHGINLPYFNLIDRDGNLITSETTKGKVVVFNFWFASCPPCIKEVPELNAVYLKYKDRTDIVFAAVTFEKESRIKTFQEKYAFAYPIVGSESDFSQSISRGAYPTNVIVGRDGTIEEYISGGMVGIGKQIEAAIEAAL